jgi:hypothetical protein
MKSYSASIDEQTLRLTMNSGSALDVQARVVAVVARKGPYEPLAALGEREVGHDRIVERRDRALR